MMAPRSLVVAAATILAVLVCAGVAGARQATDTTAPTIQGAGPISALADADCVETFCATVPFNLTATDPDDASDQIAILSNTNNGQLFFWGMSMVTCQARDPAGNLSSLVTFMVTVNVPQPTFQNVPGPIAAQATGPFGAVVTFVPPTSTDVGGRAVAVTCDHLSGITYPVGTTTVTCTAPIKRNDSQGTPITGLPVGTTQFDIVVTAATPGGGGGGGSTGGGGGTPGADTTAPTIVSKANLNVDATGSRGASVAYTVTATDPGHDPTQVTISCLPASGSIFALGLHAGSKSTTVTCHAHDQAGNQAPPMSFRVTVLGAHAQLVALEARVRATRALQTARKSALRAALVRADRYVAADDMKDARSELQAFIKKVVQLPTPLTNAPTTWIRSAKRVIAVLK
jgi:hypothetical protein